MSTLGHDAPWGRKNGPSNADLDAEVVALDFKRNGKAVDPRIKLVPFNNIQLGTNRRYLVKGLIPHPGLTVIWGPPKCGKSFWTFDLAMHVALGREYRGKRVQQGAVVYCCFEGQEGFKARAEAFRQKHIVEDVDAEIPFHLMPVTLDLIREHGDLIAAIRAAGIDPVMVNLDTLNRSLFGSENSDEDMGGYVRAADAIREAFNCAVPIVHHCGVEGSRPRGHTSLTGAAEAQISVGRDVADNVVVTVECMKDGEPGEVIVSKLERIEVGIDDDGDPITSCIVVEAEGVAKESGRKHVSRNAQTFFSILQMAHRPLALQEWNEQAKEAGLGVNRRAALTDYRNELLKSGLIYEGVQGWSVR
jgi:AAA domain